MNERYLRYILIFLSACLAIWLFFLTLGLDVSGLVLDQNGYLEKTSLPFAVKILSYLSDFSTPSSLTALISQITFFVSAVVAIFTFLYSLIATETVSRKISKMKEKLPIQIVPIQNSGKEDIDIMASYYKNSEFVHVFSGDFSWLNNNDEISNIVEKLVTDQKIKFFSSKSRSQVAEKIGLEKFSKYLPHFRFNETTGFKASLVQMSGGSQYLLYNKKEADSRNDIIIIENKDTLKEPIHKLTNLVQGVRNPPFLVLICGETGSGKSSAAKVIQSSSSAQLISVGGIFKKLHKVSGKRLRNRNDIIDIGKKYLDEFGTQALAEQIIGMIDWQKSVVIIDGLRPVDSINYLKERFPKHILVYLDAPDYIRSDRITDMNLGELNSEIDEMVRGAKSDPSSIKIDNGANSLTDLESVIDREVLEKYSVLKNF